jgi:hypothetical protein
MRIALMAKDFSHSLEMTNKIGGPVISNEVRDLSELNHDPDPASFAPPLNIR